jgi:ubiquinone/menaquinone biosynthesis C-methylase UbiE
MLIKIKNKIINIYNNIKLKIISYKGSESYWTAHLVTNDKKFKNAQDSLDYFLWRNKQYPGYIDLMPVNCANDLIVLDYGCGPGNDLVGFSEFSKAKKLIGADVSSTALMVAKKRLGLHKLNEYIELIKLDENSNLIPLSANSVDLVHSSGVLHHVKVLNIVLSEIHRILKPGGTFQVMVYNYNSIWVHLYVAYVIQIKKKKYSNLSILDAFRRSTDGPNCPISRCYSPQDFLDIVCAHGFTGSYKGSSISLTELSLLPMLKEAILNQDLAIEHRDFLSAITFDKNEYPVYNKNLAGIGACFKFTKKIN